jgi:outer membrane protein OmpA-like peptidoglycan-associated protein
LKLQVEGHTDSIGSDDYNQQLSEARAEAVRQYLIQQGIAAPQITARGMGKTEPIATNDTPEGRQQNRRVELVLSGDAIGDNASASLSTQQ